MSKSTIKKYSAEEWEYFRKQFFNSILNETEVAKLGQNVGISWPFKGKGETASRYIEFDYEELQQVPGLIGKKSRIRALMDILRETLAFDDPFADMVEMADFESQHDATFDHILAKLEIPSEYPAEFVHFSAETKQMFKEEGVNTLIEAVHFGQQLGRDAAVGADLKSFLNGLAHKDEDGIAEHVPYRRGIRGLHLPEAIGLIAADLSEAAQLHLLAQSEVELSADDKALVANASELNIEASIKSAVEKVAKVSQWFTADAAELKQIFQTVGAGERFFIMINDSRRERVALELAKLHFGVSDIQKSGFLGKLFGR